MAKDVSPMNEKIDPFLNNIQKSMYKIFNVGGNFMNDEANNNLITPKAPINQSVFTHHHPPIQNLITPKMANKAMNKGTTS
jgi:hypothetical protein